MGSTGKRRSDAADLATGGARRSARVGAPVARTPDEATLDDAAISAIETAHPDGLNVTQIVQSFEERGVQFSDATFRKWVQLGLLPRSRRVGRKGKHQGSHGLYPPSTVRRIAEIKRLMAESLTIDDIARSMRFKDKIEALDRGLLELFAGLEEQVGSPSAGLDESDRRQAERQLEQVRKQAGEVMRRLSSLERRVVAPLEREAKARAFGSGTAGGAGDLL